MLSVEPQDTGAKHKGAVNLHGKMLRERATQLISIAHPNFRGELKRWVAGTRHYLL
jgi:acyl-CoA hydrolase